MNRGAWRAIVHGVAKSRHDGVTNTKPLLWRRQLLVHRYCQGRLAFLSVRFKMSTRAWWESHRERNEAEIRQEEFKMNPSIK